MKRCKTCAHWDVEPKDVWGYCLKSGSKDMQAEDSNSLAIAYDFEGYMASLQTNANFGCVQWEKRQ